MPRIHCSILTLPDDLGTATKLRMIAEAGFDGVQASPPSPAARASFADATRATAYLPLYRLAPPRKFNWWVRGLYELRVNGGE